MAFVRSGIGAADLLRQKLAARKDSPQASAGEQPNQQPNTQTTGLGVQDHGVPPSAPLPSAPAASPAPAPAAAPAWTRPAAPSASRATRAHSGGGMRSKIKLTDDQAKAASFGLGTRAVVATAGSGKTTTMSYRISSLMDEQNVPDYEILATTFTNAGANDLKERIDSMAGRVTGIQTGTLHSFCVKLVFIHAAELGYTGQPTILDERQRSSQIEGLMLQVTGKTSKSDITTFSTDDVYKWLGELEVREFSSDPRDQSPWTVGKKTPGAVAEICRLYKERSRQYGYMDFDSILSEALRLLRKAPPAVVAALPKYVFIDEAQDLSAIQWFIIEELARHAKSLDIIGDDDQSIYGWRAALPWRFRNFVEKADQRFFLSANRRCAASIVRLASQIIGVIPSTRRIVKDLSAVREVEGSVRFSILTSMDAVSLIAKKIKGEVEEKKKSYADFALIVRSTTRVFDAVEGAFKRLGIPYKILGGKSTFDKPEARLIRALGNLVVKKDGAEPLAHWTTLLSEIGVSGESTDKVLKEALSTGGSFDSIYWAVKRSRISERNKKNTESLIEGVAALRMLDRPTLADLFGNKVIEATILDVIHRRSKAEVEAKRKREGGMTDKQVEELIEKYCQDRASSLFSAMSSLMNDPLQVAMISLDMSSKEEDDGQPKVTLSTAHSSKGLEWDTVFVMEANKSSWPSAMAGRGLGNVPQSVHEDVNDEERRLLYVAVTRAKNDLYLVSTSVHPMSHDSQSPSEFLPKWLQSAVGPAFDEVRQSQQTKGVTLQVPLELPKEAPKAPPASFTIPKQSLPSSASTKPGEAGTFRLPAGARKPAK